MVIDIKNDEGRVVYQMDSPMVSELGSAQKLVADMPALVKKCREARDLSDWPDCGV